MTANDIYEAIITMQAEPITTIRCDADIRASQAKSAKFEKLFADLREASADFEPCVGAVIRDYDTHWRIIHTTDKALKVVQISGSTGLPIGCGHVEKWIPRTRLNRCTSRRIGDLAYAQSFWQLIGDIPALAAQ